MTARNVKLVGGGAPREPGSKNNRASDLRKRCPQCKVLRKYHEPHTNTGGQLHGRRAAWGHDATGRVICGWCVARAAGDAAVQTGDSRYGAVARDTTGRVDPKAKLAYRAARKENERARKAPGTISLIISTQGHDGDTNYFAALRDELSAAPKNPPVHREGACRRFEDRHKVPNGPNRKTTDGSTSHLSCHAVRVGCGAMIVRLLKPEEHTLIDLEDITDLTAEVLSDNGPVVAFIADEENKALYEAGEEYTSIGSDVPSEEHEFDELLEEDKHYYLVLANESPNAIAVAVEIDYDDEEEDDGTTAADGDDDEEDDDE